MRKLIFCVCFLLFFINCFAQKGVIPIGSQIDTAKTKTDTSQKDIGEVINKAFKKNIFKEDTTLKEKWKLYPAVLPAVGYTLSTSFAATVTANGAFYTDDPNKVNLSVVNIGPTATLKEQFFAPVQTNIWTKGNKYNFLGEAVFYTYPQNTYGLGAHTSLSDADKLDYHYILIREAALRKIVPDVYAGVGYAYDDHWDIREDGPVPAGGSDYDKYGATRRSTSSGIMYELLFDKRINPINPPGGYYLNITYRENLTVLGSDQNWQSMIIDARKYIRLSKHSKNVLAFWGYGWLTLHGNPPYLDLPSTAWDTYANQGRGYIQSRFRGRNLLSLESEYRFGITRNGLIGGTVFANAQTVSNYPDNNIDKLWPGAGFGLRIKFNRHSNTNLAIDYAEGLEGSGGFFVNLGEVF